MFFFLVGCWINYEEVVQKHGPDSQEDFSLNIAFSALRRKYRLVSDVTGLI